MSVWLLGFVSANRFQNNADFTSLSIWCCKYHLDLLVRCRCCVHKWVRRRILLKKICSSHILHESICFGMKGGGGVYVLSIARSCNPSLSNDTVGSIMVL